ncbi:MAG TPA: transglycosylase domain-containing protein [Solirubrobacterales bacterium]|nr:transglycosylase domain-containing protein [Solirubrobacterales bacterium]
MDSGSEHEHVSGQREASGPRTEDQVDDHATQQPQDANGAGAAPGRAKRRSAAAQSNGSGGRNLLRRRDRRLVPLPGSGQPPDKPKRPRLRKLRIAVVILGLSILAFVSWIFGIMMAVAQDLPSLENREQYSRAHNSVVYDQYGQKLATLTNNAGRILLDSEQIAPVMKDAVVAIEDQRFYEHRGVDFQGIARAVWADIASGSAAQGASTITQQFVKNALAAQNSRTVFQKLREAALAYHLERQWPKDKILTEYLNEIYFGEGATGVEAAAKTYFGYNHPGCGTSEGDSPCASQLLPWEAATLAGIISSPSAYSPRNFPENALARRNQVLQNMADVGYITPEEYTEYSQEPLPKPSQIEPPAENSAAPYFTSWLRQQLVDRYGAGEAFGGGLQIKSTLDLALQQRVEDITASTLAGIPPTASIAVLDNDTAGVLAMVGGPDYQNAPFNLATNGHRQPGSSFKPFTLITALEQGRSPDEVFASAPQQIPFKVKLPKKNGNGYKILPDLFEVSNYEDSYLGSASIQTATTYSDNSVYSQLGTQVGVENVAETAHKLGIETDLRSPDARYSVNGGPWQPYNPALILGGLTTGVNTLERAHAYNTVEEDGRRISGSMGAGPGRPVGVLDVTDGGDCVENGGTDCYQEGDPVPDQTGSNGVNRVIAKPVLDPGVAQTAKSILTMVVTSGTGEQAQTGEPTWGKTGTTDDNGDAWFCGATPKITACVWVGYPDEVKPMETEFAGGPVDGGTFPALIFAQIVNAYEELESERHVNDDVESDETTDTSSDTYAPPVTTTEESVAPATPEADTSSAPAPADSSSAEPAPSTDGGGTAAPTGGGVAPG